METGINIQIYDGAISSNTRQGIADFRRSVFSHDQWSPEDENCIHVTAQMEGQILGYYRLFEWGDWTDEREVLDISPMAKVFDFSPKHLAARTVFEVSRFCIDPRAKSRFLPRTFSGVACGR